MNIQIEPWHFWLLAVGVVGWGAKKFYDLLAGIDALLKFSNERQAAIITELEHASSLRSSILDASLGMVRCLDGIASAMLKGDLRDSIDKLSASTESFSNMPDYVKGIEKVCGELVVNVSSLQHSVRVFQRSIFQQDPNPRSADIGLKEHNEEAAFRAGEEQALMNEGLSAEEAATRAAIKTDEVFGQRAL